MTKSELIEKLSTDFSHVQVKDIESSVKEILEQMATSLANNERIEIRGFGSFFSALPRTSCRSQSKNRR